MSDHKYRRFKDDNPCDSIGFGFLDHCMKNLPEMLNSCMCKGPFDFFEGSLKTGERWPITEVNSTEEGYIITMELPGITKEQINLEITENELSLSAKNETLNKQYKKHLEFKKSVNPTKIDAKLKAGILTIHVPYSQLTPKTKVNIEDTEESNNENTK